MMSHDAIPSVTTAFLTAVRTVEVSVIALPRGPDIAGTRASYSLQENISANCSTTRSLPEPEISWYINGDNVDHSSVTVFNHHHDNTTHEKDLSPNHHFMRLFGDQYHCSGPYFGRSATKVGI